MLRYQPAPCIHIDHVSCGKQGPVHSSSYGGDRHDEPRDHGAFHASIADANLVRDEIVSDQSAGESVGSGHFGSKDILDCKRLRDRDERLHLDSPSYADMYQRGTCDAALAGYATGNPLSAGEVSISTHAMVTEALRHGADASGRAA